MNGGILLPTVAILKKTLIPNMIILLLSDDGFHALICGKSPWADAMVGAKITEICFILVPHNSIAISQCKKIILSHLCQSFITLQETPTIILMKTGTFELRIYRNCDHTITNKGIENKWNRKH